MQTCSRLADQLKSQPNPNMLVNQLEHLPQEGAVLAQARI